MQYNVLIPNAKYAYMRTFKGRWCKVSIAKMQKLVNKNILHKKSLENALPTESELYFYLEANQEQEVFNIIKSALSCYTCPGHDNH